MPVKPGGSAAKGRLSPVSSDTVNSDSGSPDLPRSLTIRCRPSAAHAGPKKAPPHEAMCCSGPPSVGMVMMLLVANAVPRTKTIVCPSGDNDAK